MNARYRWYKETLDAAHAVYGLKFDFISADQSETDMADGFSICGIGWITKPTHRMITAKSNWLLRMRQGLGTLQRRW